MTHTPHFSQLPGLRSQTVLIFLGFLMITGAANASPLEHWHRLIQSGYSDLQRETEALQSASKNYCDAPSSGARTQLDGHLV